MIWWGEKQERDQEKVNKSQEVLLSFHNCCKEKNLEQIRQFLTFIANIEQ